MKWSSAPFLLITPALIAGILLFEQSKGVDFVFTFIPIVVLMALVLLLSVKPAVFGQYRQFALVLLVVAIALLGYLSAQLTYVSAKPRIDAESLSKASFYTALISSKPDKTAKSFRYEVMIEGVKVDTTWRKLNNKAVLYSLDSTIFRFGDLLLIKGKPQLLRRQQNPHVFDYSIFLNRKGIFLEGYCRTGNYQIMAVNRQGFWSNWVMEIGDTFEAILSRYITSPEALDLAKAMVLGRRNEMKPAMEEVYAATGTSHILAVSGLHVGIIYIVASFAFGFARRKGMRWLYYLLVLASIWGFAIITGLSPSVRRAGIMLTFIIVGEMLNRKSNIYNTLFASAFLILVFSPNLIFSVSFQLSYLAVLGIVLFYKKTYRLLYLKNRVLDFFWQISALSLSVQLATFAISIYYFHHFPALFLITNLAAIPTATVVLIGSLSVFATSFLPYIPDLIGDLVQWWIYGYQKVLILLSRWDITSIEGLTLKSHHVFLIMVFVLLLHKLIESRSLSVFVVITVLLVLSSFYIGYDQYRLGRQQLMTMYALKDGVGVDVFVGSKCYSDLHGALRELSASERYVVEPNRMHHSIIDVLSIDSLPISQAIGQNRLLVLDGKSFLMIKNADAIANLLQSSSIDYLVVGSDAIAQLLVIEQWNFDKLILDASCTEWDIAKVEEQLPHEVDLHAMNRDGAFVIQI
jgi:competence protein ComEC